MAFPVIAASNTSQQDTTNVTSHTVNLPAGIVSGNLIIVVFGVDGSGSPTVTFPGTPGVDWTAIVSQINASQGIVVAWRRADGSEGASITVTTSTAELSAHRTYRISGDSTSQAPEASAALNASAGTQSSPSLTPTGGAKDYLWLTLCSADNSGSTDITGFPANYANTGSIENTNAQGVALGYGTRELNAASEDPGDFTLSVADTAAVATIAIHPAAVASAAAKTGGPLISNSLTRPRLVQ